MLINSVLLCFGTTIDIETECYVFLSEMCFFRRLQRHTTTTSFFNTLTFSHTQTLTHTHMTGQRWLAGQVVPDFSGFANIFDPKEGRKNF